MRMRWWWWAVAVLGSVPRARAAAPLAALAARVDAQRRLAATFGTCAAARAFYNTSGLVAESAALVGGRMSRPRPGQKLAFIHVPKNAGTTIERVRTTTGIRKIRGRHLVKPDGSRYPGALRWPGSGNCSCSLWHVPPRYVPADAAPVYPPEMRTFCVVRDPLDKVLSQFRMMAKPKDLDHLSVAEAKLCGLMRARFGHRCQGAHSDCHVWPQSDGRRLAATSRRRERVSDVEISRRDGRTPVSTDPAR